jgi:membrane-associated phospholipid phosphatase
VLAFARRAGHTPARDRGMASFARIGDHSGVWLALGLLGAATSTPPRRAAWWRATAVIAGSYALNQTIKIVVRRPRPAPDEQLAHMHTQLSFPSAHATTSLCGARVLHAAGAPAAPLYGLAAALAYSRVYLGVHYPSDVLAGAILGDSIGRLASR